MGLQPTDQAASTTTNSAVFTAMLCAIRLYGFAVWVYLAANSIVHPVTMRRQLTHFAGWPNEDTVAVLCFGASLLAALILVVRRGTP